MSGVFGLMDCHRCDPFPMARIIEAGSGIISTDLQRAGLMFEGAVGTALIGLVPSRTWTGRAEIFIGGMRLQTRPSLALNFRYWVCPVCDHSCRHLYCIGGQWKCRICGRLDYVSRHCFRTLPGYHRARWLRRRLQLPLQLFLPLPDYPPHHSRKRRLARELRVLESTLAKHLQSVNDTLDKRRAAGKRWPGTAAPRE